jgi:hypothetical protein
VFLAGCALHLLGTLLHSLVEDEMVSSEAIARRILELVMGCDLQESKALPSVSSYIWSAPYIHEYPL